MGKAITVAAVALLVVVLFAFVGDSLPEGSTLHGIASNVREVGRSIAGGFGGGYTKPLTG